MTKRCCISCGERWVEDSVSDVCHTCEAEITRPIRAPDSAPNGLADELERMIEEFGQRENEADNFDLSTWLWKHSKTVAAALRNQSGGAVPTFDAWWATMRARGFDYGEDALELVRMGYSACRALRSQPGGAVPRDREIAHLTWHLLDDNSDGNEGLEAVARYDVWLSKLWPLLNDEHDILFPERAMYDAATKAGEGET